MRRVLCAGFALTLLVGAGAAVAQQVPLIDRELFFGDPQISGAQLSPNGEYVSFRKPYHGVMNIWVKGIDDPFDAARPITADTTRPVRGYFWSRDSRLILYVQDKGGNEDFHVYAVDPAAAPEAETGVPPARDLTPYENTRAVIYDVPRATPGQILVGLNDRDARWHDVYRLDLATGERELIIENTDEIAGWVVDNDGAVRMGVRVAQDGGTEILRLDGDRLVEVYSCSNEESCGPVRFHKDGRRVYMITNRGDDVDLTRLALLDPLTGDEEFIESDPDGRVDFGGATFSDVTNEILATFYVGDRVRIYPKDDDFARILERLRALLPGGEISFGSSTADERVFIVRVSRDVDPGSAYIYDIADDELTFLYRSRPDLPTEHLAEMIPVRYTGRDGLVIPAYLTLPRGVEAEQLPTVILPHGGPWARDRWGYDPFAQFLANRGYAVLQPNFRGSTGYGKAFLNAGNREWGTGYMQHDITDGVRYLIEEGIADPDRVGIFGGSYGGYATLAGLAFTPDVYAAGVSYVGPSNLITLLNSIPPYWEAIKKIFNVRLGDLDDPDDRRRLIEQSPLFSAEQIDAPLLVIQGANDPRVKKAESEQIVVALRDLGRQVEYMLAEDEGHGFAGRENRLAVAAAMERFFAEHLGSRYQEELPEDIATRLAALTVDVNTVVLPDALAAATAETAPLPPTQGVAIQAGTLEYTTTIEMMGQQIPITVTRTIEPASYQGQEVWRLIDVADTPMGTGVDTVEVDRGTLLPLRRVAGGMGTITLSYTEEAVTGEIGGMGQTVPVNVALDAPTFAGEGGLELAIAGLELEEGYETSLRVFSALERKVRPMLLVVTGTEAVDCAAGTFEAFVLEIKPLDGDDAGTATMYVMRSSPHVVIRSTIRLPAMMGGGTATTELTAISLAGH